MNTRTIKFRVWNGYEMDYNPKIVSSSTILDINKSISEDECIWMQFVGIIDSNEKEVYECDKVILTSRRSSEDVGIYKGIVEYDELAARFIVRHDMGTIKLDSTAFSIEVVGNAFEL
jgi:uncharacterized phage protein (TIGR01671 family)